MAAQGMPNGVNLTWDNLGGGGGGSYGITTLTDFGAINTDHGSVTITLTTPSVALEVIGVAVVTGSSATSTALTTTGRIGVNTAAPTVDLDVNGEGNIVSGLTIGSSTVAGASQKLSIYHSSDARIMLRGGADINNGLLIGNSPSNSFITYQNPLGEFVLNCEQNRPMKFKTTNTDRMTITGAGRVGIGTNSP
ncbi:hypothetical protein EBV26_21490, partial [bacterium]|nr:hypothetical protein [bacterium]